MKAGFTQSGAMDQYSMKLANALCGNEPNSPVIEMTALGITARFTDEHIFCLCGGDFGATLNGKPLDKNYITYKDIADGGVMRLVMGPEPNKERGTGKDAAPFSLSRPE